MTKKILILFFYTLLLNACIDVDVQPTDEVAAEQAFASESSVRAVLNGVYDGLQSGAIVQDYILYADLAADNLNAVGSKIEYREVSNNRVTTFNVDIEGIWNSHYDVVNRAKKLTFQEAGSKFQRSRGGRFKVTLGVMPDFAGVEKRGMRVDAVSKGKPAHAAGMKNGDIIIAINGKKVGNIYEYMDRLQKLEAGETISVDVLRDGKPTVLIVQL